MNGEFKKNACDKEARRVKARAKKGMGTFAWIGTLGIVGWSITVPLLIGIALGRWLEGIFPGRYSFTLMFMFAGLVLGCIAAWRWIKKASKGSNHDADTGVPAGTEKGDREKNDREGGK